MPRTKSTAQLRESADLIRSAMPEQEDPALALACLLMAEVYETVAASRELRAAGRLN
jgi:hypothetical protein